MILEQIQNIAQGINCNDEESYTNSIENCGIAIRSSGHLLSVTSRARVPNLQRSDIGTREEIDGFTASSASRFKRFLRESVAEYSVLITLTYPGTEGYDGQRAKRDLKVFMQRLRRRAKLQPYWSAVWFLEFQSRGSVHFHIFTNQRFEKEWIAKSWYEICGTEDERHFRAGTRIESIRSGRHGISAYAAKYAVKQQQKVVPKDFGWCGRFWGVCGDRRRVSADTWVPVVAYQSMAVKRKLKVLEECLETLVFNGQAKYIQCKRDGITLLYLKNQHDISQIRAMITNIDIAAYWHRPRIFEWLYGEHIEDISEDK